MASMHHVTMKAFQGNYMRCKT